MLKQTAPTALNITGEENKNICVAICDCLATHQVFAIDGGSYRPAKQQMISLD